MEPENEQFEDLPQSLIDELKAADQPLPQISARVDLELAKLARDQFSGRRQPAVSRRPAWAAIAATVLIAVFVVQLRGPEFVDPGSVYADIDRSGRIDIADVLALARTREIEDLTQAELDAFAMQIVSLNPVGDAS